MGFIKWLIEQYRIYKAEKYLKPKSQQDADKVFINNYYKCIESGLTTAQVNAIINLCIVGDKWMKKGE